MLKLAGKGLTARGVAAFWVLWSLAFVLMLWAVSPGRTLQEALAAELLRGHLANASAGAKCRDRLPEGGGRGWA